MTVRVLTTTAAGLGLGLSWGIAARVWMRLISTEPEFSWTGTVMILALTGLTGLVLGLLYGVRRTGRSRWWRVLAVLCLPMFASPGMIFFPAFLLGGLLYLPHLWVLHGGFLILSLTLAAGAAELYRPRSGEAAVAHEELAVDPLTAR